MTIVGRTVSLAVSHFSTGGIAQSVCGPSVTSAVGIAACRIMAQNLSRGRDDHRGPRALSGAGAGARDIGG